MVNVQWSVGYSEGSGSVGLVISSALAAAEVNDCTTDGWSTWTSVSVPRLCTSNVITTCPLSDIAVCGMPLYQFRLSCARNFRIHGPKLAPLESNWSGPIELLLPSGLSYPACSAYRNRFSAVNRPPDGRP